MFDNLFVLTFQIPISNENTTASEQERMAPTPKEGENELSYIDELRLERRMRQSGIAAADDDDDDDDDADGMAPTTKEGENELSYIDELRLERRMRQSGIAAADDDDDDDDDADGGIATGQRTYTNREAYARFSATPSAFAECLGMEADDTLFDNHRMRLYDRPLQRQLWGSPVMDVDIKWNTLVRAVRLTPLCLL